MASVEVWQGVLATLRQAEQEYGFAVLVDVCPDLSTHRDEAAYSWVRDYETDYESDELWSPRSPCSCCCP
mgnify:CR=1 FL=1